MYRLVLIALVAISSLALPVQAVENSRVTQWERDSAIAAVNIVDIDIAVHGIGVLGSLSDGETTLQKLIEIETRNDWSLPAREAVIYKFTQSLSQLPRDAIAVEVMQHLRSYESLVLVPGEDHSRSLVPLFNVRGAAAGVENSWQRSEWTRKGAVLIETNPSLVVSEFTASTSHNQRSGLIDALHQAEIENVALVQELALEQFKVRPELTGILAATSVITNDVFANCNVVTTSKS